jgi:hypothetical protein
MPGLTTTKAKLDLFRLPSVPPLVSLRLGRTSLLPLVGLFLSELSILELGPTTALEQPSAVVAMVELVVISLSPILDWYRFNDQYHSCVFPCQQVLFASHCGVHPCLVQGATLRALHIGMSKLQA